MGGLGMSRKLKICVLGTAKSPQIVARTAAFRARGHDVAMISPVPEDWEAVDADYPKRDLGRGWIGKLYMAGWIAVAMMRRRADVYHAHYAAELTTWISWLLRRRPMVISVMGGDVLFEEQGTLGPVGRWLTRCALRGADFVTVKTHTLGDVVARFGVPRDRIEVVIWGVDLDRFRFSPELGQAYRRSLDIPADRPVALSPRMLAPFYNVPVMLEAWVSVVDRLPDALLLISELRGTPAFKEELRARVRDLGLEESVQFAPPLPLAEMPRAFSAADAVISIPPSDGYPQAVMEAAACRCPVILADLPHLHEVLKPDEHARYTDIAPKALAEAVIETLADRATANARAERAVAQVARLANFEENVARVERRLLTLAGAH